MSKVALVILTLLSIQACVNIPSQAVTGLAQPQQFARSGAIEAPNAWWEAFANDGLNDMVKRSLLASPDLETARLRLQRSALEVDLAETDLWPNLTATSSDKTRREHGKVDTDSYAFSLSARYELDLWGRLQDLNTIARLEYQAKVSDFSLRRNLVAGNVTLTWFRWLAELEKLSLLNTQRRRVENALTAIKRRYSLGKIPATDVWQQQRLLESVTVNVLRAEAAAQLAVDDLALWQGLTRDQMVLPAAVELPQVPPLPDTGIPLEKLRQRADIRQAYALLEAAHLEVAVAMSERLPRFSLSASTNSQAGSSADLFSQWARELTANMVLPIVDGGARTTKLAQQQLAWRAQASFLQSQWLQAIHEVESSLTIELREQNLFQSISEQLRLARQTERLQRMRYVNGKVSYLSLLRAQESSLSLERQHINARFLLLNARTQLYRALSHGDFGGEYNSEQET